MKLSTSVKAALAILALLVVYFVARTLTRPAGEAAVAAGEDALFSVVTETVAPQEWRDIVTVRGRTAAERKVVVRAETPGAVAATPAREGALVKTGETLCKLKVDARAAAVREAEAALAKANLDYEAGEKLAAEGFRSDTSLAGLKAARDLARANVEQARVTLAKTDIVAPFDGVFEDRLAEVGDFLGVGDPCGVVVQQSPFLVTGAVSERDVGKIARGDRGVARLATGETIEGVVRFVAASADAATRTFAVELEVPNPDGTLRDGVTAEFDVFAARRDAHLVPRSALTLDDEGRIGLRIVGADDIVAFKPVRLIGESPDGVWIAGLDGAATVIVRGQDFVSPGQKVKAVPHTEIAS